MPFTPEETEKVCKLLAEDGLTLRQAADKMGISDSLIIWNARHDEGFAKQYARAIEMRTDIDFERLEDDLADPERGKSGIDAAWVQWKRLQIDTRKWALSKRNPKKYGDRIQQDISGELNIGLAERISEARKRKSAVSDEKITNR